MELLNILENCLNFIESNLDKKLSLEDLALETGFSKFHLHRVFKSLTGETIIDYINARKLTTSIDDLLNSNKRILDIALDYGFEYEQSYIRAFKSKFEATPHKVRNENISVILREKINLSEIISINNTITYRPFFVYKPKFNLVGNQYNLNSRSGDSAANFHGKEFFYKQKVQIKNAVNPNIYYGYTEWNKSSTGYIQYMPSLEVNDLSDVPLDMDFRQIPSNKYVVFRFVGFFNPDELNGRALGRLLVHMYRKWIFNSGYKFSDTYRFENIDNSLSKDNYCEVDIYQPIQEKCSCRKEQ